MLYEDRDIDEIEARAAEIQKLWCCSGSRVSTRQLRLSGAVSVEVPWRFDLRKAIWLCGFFYILLALFHFILILLNYIEVCPIRIYQNITELIGQTPLSVRQLGSRRSCWGVCEVKKLSALHVKRSDCSQHVSLVSPAIHRWSQRKYWYRPFMVGATKFQSCQKPWYVERRKLSSLWCWS